MTARARGLARLGPLALVSIGLLRAAPLAASERATGQGLVVDEGPSFALVRDAGALAEAACAPGELGQAALRDAVQRVQRELALDATLAVVLTSAPPSCRGLFYAAVANDVRGIGYGHERADELFDDSPDSALEGIAFLNDWPYWETRPEELERAFKHELGHRWGARVRAAIDGAPSSELLGRQLMHWSFFLDTGASPLEGNAWHTSDDRTFVSKSESASGAFSMLDLYLMGVAEPGEVAPMLLLRNIDAATLENARDCRAAPLGASSPPARCAPLTLEAEPRWIRIEDIVAVEGARAPSPVRERTLDLAVIVLESARMPLELESCRALERALADNLAEFERATHGRIALHNQTGFGTSCEDGVRAAPTLNGQRGCSLAYVAGMHASLIPSALAGLCACLMRRRARRARTDA